MSENQHDAEKTNLLETNFISNISNEQSNDYLKNNSFEHNSDVINNLNIFFNSSSNNISKSNDYLCSLVTWSNGSNFMYSLLNPVNFNLKLFSINSLLHLFTNDYAEIEIEKAKMIFDSLLNYLFQHRHVLFEKSFNINKNLLLNNEKIIDESNNEKLYMKSLMKLICRIIRVFYPQCNYFKKFVSIVTNKSLIYDNDSDCFKIITNIFTEVIYQFQTNFGLNKNIIQMSKYFGTLEEFKDSSLINIFNYSCDIVLKLIEHKIQTDNFRDMLQLSKQAVLCLQECLDYSEDINVKEEDYNKYEIKPTIIPSQRRRGKDKKLNINLLNNLCQNLFDLYNIIVKTFISFNNNNNNNESNVNEEYLEYYYISEGVLKVLNSLVCMKIQYLDTNKGRILKTYSSNLGGILFNQYGFIHHEYICQIIYRLKKNYNYIDLTTGNETFWALIFPYIETSINIFTNKNNKKIINDSLDFIKNNNIIDSSPHSYLPGILYLLRFLGYFSHNLYKISLNYQIKIKQNILSICKSMIEMNFSEYEFEMADICKSFGVCAEGIYFQILEDMITYIKNDFKNMEIINLCFKIRFGIEMIKNNYQYIEEQRLTNKLSYNDLDCFSDIDLSDDKPEMNAIVNFIKCVFDIIKDIVYMKENIISNNKNMNHFGLLSNTLLRFIKFFCKHFLSKYLNNSLTYMINGLLIDESDINRNEKEESTPEDLIVFIFNVLILFNIKSGQKNNLTNINSNILKNINNNNLEDKLLNHKIVLKILNILSDNFSFETDYSNKICQLQSYNTLNNNVLETISSKYLNDNTLINDNDEISGGSSPSDHGSYSNKKDTSIRSSIISTPNAESNILNNESIENISKISFSQKLPNNHHNNKNFHINKSSNDNNMNIINEAEVTINSVDIHLGKIRLNQNKFINILKELFNKVIIMNSDMLSFKVKKHFIVFLFKIIFQCYLPFEAAIHYFIIQLSKIKSNDIKEFIYIMSAMISSVTTQENYQILIDTILPSIQTLCNSITCTPFNNNFNDETIISLKKVLKLLKDITDLEKSHIKTFTNNSQSPIQIFSLAGNLLDYYISLAQNINLKNLNEDKIYLIQIKPISYYVQIYYNLFSFYIQVPLFINTNYIYMKNLFYKITNIIFSIDLNNLIGYCDKFRYLMKLLKVIYCDYIIQDSVLINNIGDNNFTNINEFICDINHIPTIIKLFIKILNEDYINNSEYDKNGNIIQNQNKTNTNYEKINISPITKSAENIRECYKDFNDIVYEWCKLYIQNKNNKSDVSSNNSNSETIKENTSNILSPNNNNPNNINNNTNIIDNNDSTKILFNIFNNINTNLLLNNILLPLLQGLLLNYYSITEINNSLSKSIFILAYAFHDQYLNIFNNILTSNEIKKLFSEEEINSIKFNFEQLNNAQNYIGLNNGSNNINGLIFSYYNVFKEKLKEFVEKIQNIIVSRKKDINCIDINDENMLD